MSGTFTVHPAATMDLLALLRPVQAACDWMRLDVPSRQKVGRAQGGERSNACSNLHDLCAAQTAIRRRTCSANDRQLPA
jgi:hypothetical protein